MIKFWQNVLAVMTALAGVAAISASTLFFKGRYDQAMGGASRARMTETDLNSRWTIPDVAARELPARIKIPRTGRETAAVQALIDEEMPDASPEEREIWAEELKERSFEESREILALRRRFSSAAAPSSDDAVQFTVGDRIPPRKLPESGTAQAAPVVLDARDLSASIAALQSAEQVLASSIASAQAELEKLREQLKALREIRTESSEAAPVP